jgi:putative peptidoglycan lipid II flippase
MAGGDAGAAAHAGVVRSAGIMSAAVATSRVTGLIREIVLARLFGASQTYDAFRLGFMIPNLTRDLFAEGALSSAFVPEFTASLDDKRAAQRLANLVFTAVLIIVGAICLLGMAFAPQLVDIFAPGFRQVPGKFEESVHLVRIMFPFLLLVALAAQVMGMLNACNRFAVPALSSSLFNVGSLVFGLTLGFAIGPHIGITAIDGMAWGVVIGGMLQLAGQLPTLRKEGFSLRPAIDWSHPGLRQIIRLMGPAVLGGAAVQINVMVITNIASFLTDPLRGPNGPVSWLGWAFRFVQLPIGLFGVATASATLPAISRSFASGDIGEFRRTISRSLGLVFLLTVPSAVGLAVLGRPMIAAIFEGGKFDAYDTQQTALAMSCYALGLLGYSATKVLNPGFYALRDSRTPMLVSLGTIVINYAAATVAVQYTELGHVGLALTTSAVATFSFVVQFWLLRNRLGGIYGRGLASSTVKISLVSAAMGVLVWALRLQCEAWFGVSQWASILALAICLPSGIGLFYFGCRLLRVSEIDSAVAAVAAPFRRVFGGSRDRIV